MDPAPASNLRHRLLRFLSGLPKPVKFAAAGAGLLVIGTGIGFTAVHFLSSKRPQVSADIISSTPFPLYVPKKLPAGYKVDASSFRFGGEEGEAILTFEATDSAGDKIIFTEQARPDGFSPTAFASKNLINPATITGTAYPTSAGQTQDHKSTLISIATPKTWVLANSSVAFSNQDVQKLGQGSYRY
jgi:hypothetical protein